MDRCSPTADAPAPGAPTAAAVPLWRRAGRDPVLCGLALLVPLLTVWHLSGVAAGVLDDGVHLVYPVMDVTMAASAYAVVRASRERAVRRFWRYLSIAGGLFCVADILAAVVEISDYAWYPRTAMPINIPAALAALSTILWAMLSYPTAVETARQRLRFWLDAGTVLLAAATFLWYLAIAPTIIGTATSTGAKVGQSFYLLLWPSVLLAAIFGMTKLILTELPPVTRGAAAALVAAAISSAAVHAAVTNSATVESRFPLLFLIPGCCLVTASRLQLLQTRVGRTARRRRRYSLLPYTAIAATDLLLLVVILPELGPRSIGVVVGVVTIGLLVVSRQLDAFAANSQLLDRLDASMAEVRRHEQRFRSLLAHSSDITTIMDADGRYRYASPAMLRILGHKPEELIGTSLTDHLHPDDATTFRPQLTALSVTPGATMTFQARYRHADGGWHWLEMICTNLLEDPDVAGMVGNAREVTEARQLHDRLRHQASHDALTQLANRSLFHERLHTALATTGRPTAVLLIDLDDFKTINDTLGHHIGDAVLVGVAERIRRCVRADVDTPARLGGDEFAIVLPGADQTEAAKVSERLLAALTDPIRYDGHTITAQASIGFAIGTQRDPEELLHAADHAMYTAKRQGKGRYAQAH